jgi:DNA-binding transcriptional ArsR family regulator
LLSGAAVARALANPLRIAILDLLEEHVLSPKELAKELDISLQLASYHVRLLSEHRLIELERTEQRRGALQHFYRSAPRPVFPDAEWEQLPQEIKRELLEASLLNASAAITTAVRAGGFDRAEMHWSRTTIVADARAWEDLAALLTRTLLRVEQIQRQAARRLAASGEAPSRATVVLTAFESPERHRKEPS